MTNVIGMAGHVDHGKSSVVKALTGKVTARYREEIEREITIDIGFARLEIDGFGEVSIIDVPGHEDFIHNMIAGVGGIKLAVMVIAANEGIKPQTVEHFEILKLIGVKKIIFVLNKSDLASEFDIEYRKAEIEEFILGTDYAGSVIIVFSAEKKTGVAELKNAIKEGLVKCDTAGPGIINDDCRTVLYPVDRFFEKHGAGHIATGTLQAGRLLCDNEYLFMPSKTSGRVKSIEINGRKQPEAHAGFRVAVNIVKEKNADISRGAFLVPAGYGNLFKAATVKLSLCRDLDKNIKSGHSIKFYFYSACYKAKLRLLEGTSLSAGSCAYCQIIFEKPEFVVPFANFIIRQHTGECTLGGGFIIDCSAMVVKNKKEIVSIFSGMPAGSDIDALAFRPGYLREILKKNYFMKISDAALYLGVRRECAAEALNAVTGSNGSEFSVINSDFVTSPFLMESACEVIKEAAVDYLKKNEGSREIGRRALLDIISDVREENRMFWDSLIDILIARKIFSNSEKGLLPEFIIKKIDSLQVMTDKKAEEIRNKILKSFEPGGNALPKTLDDVKALVPKNHSPAFNAALKFAENQKQIFRIFDNYYISRAQYDSYIKILSELSSDKKLFTVIDFKDKSCLSRKYAIGVLEFFDRLGVTVRTGNERELSDNFRLTLTAK